MVPAPEIHTSSTVEVPCIELKISFVKGVFVAIVNWVYRHLIFPRLYVNSRIFVQELELDLPPPSKVK
jgi:hypothetical protein